MDRVVYIVCVKQDSIKHREKLILSLQNIFARMALVTQTGTIVDDKKLLLMHILIRLDCLDCWT